MAQFSIGEVEQLTGIKAHVLRYWEEVIPSLKPRKDLGGRRVYSTRDVQLILRLKHLIQKRHFTIESAYNQLIREASMNTESARTIQLMNEMRGTLLSIYKRVHKP